MGADQVHRSDPLPSGNGVSFGHDRSHALVGRAPSRRVLDRHDPPPGQEPGVDHPAGSRGPDDIARSSLEIDTAVPWTPGFGGCQEWPLDPQRTVEGRLPRG